MQRVPLLILSILLLCASSGCSVCRSIEQWKCDNWGMCHFGIKPSQTCPPPACDSSYELEAPPLTFGQ